ncbi:hypothetical protein E2C01_005565 [Portunus trituberculatus]|uniref:Uncharacterized protein n=1 Tax=Portunus trituberculatus TaxID=210409 RepID=A0A5B7CVF8_PORTR|nr:hypothetical protein [Portunus trituberculatus]
MCRGGGGGRRCGGRIPVSGGVLGDSRGQWRGYVILFNCRRLAFDVPRGCGALRWLGGKRERGEESEEQERKCSGSGKGEVKWCKGKGVEC